MLEVGEVQEGQDARAQQEIPLGEPEEVSPEHHVHNTQVGIGGPEEETIVQVFFPLEVLQPGFGVREDDQGAVPAQVQVED